VARIDGALSHPASSHNHNPPPSTPHPPRCRGTWRTEEFKEYNFNALGLPTNGGALHPLLKVRSQYRKIFTQMGFEEMPTNNYVESSFWNFDALFQPQQVPGLRLGVGGGMGRAALLGV